MLYLYVEIMLIYKKVATPTTVIHFIILVPLLIHFLTKLTDN